MLWVPGARLLEKLYYPGGRCSIPLGIVAVVLESGIALGGLMLLVACRIV